MTGFERVMVACMGLIMQALALIVHQLPGWAARDLSNRLTAMSEELRQMV